MDVHVCVHGCARASACACVCIHETWTASEPESSLQGDPAPFLPGWGPRQPWTERCSPDGFAPSPSAPELLSPVGPRSTHAHLPPLPPPSPCSARIAARLPQVFVRRLTSCFRRNEPCRELMMEESGTVWREAQGVRKGSGRRRPLFILLHSTRAPPSRPRVPSELLRKWGPGGTCFPSQPPQAPSQHLRQGWRGLS